ncbi:MAG: ATP-dependent DNA ligase [Planctomycetota bacterium]
MHAFAQLFAELDQTTSSKSKIDAIARYLSNAPPSDAAWAVYFLSGQRPKRLVGWRELNRWAQEASQLPAWLYDECASLVGDSAETVAILAGPMHAQPAEQLSLAEWVEARVLPLRDGSPSEQRAAITGWWAKLGEDERFILTKLLTGGFRIGVSKTTVIRALAKAFALDRAVIAQRLAGSWRPTPEFFERLTSLDDTGEQRGPYAFYLASPLGDTPHEGKPPPAALGEIGDWFAEWKWDGIRAQLIRRDDELGLWSRGDEDLTERFPEITTAAGRLRSNGVLDGELLCFRDGSPLPFSALQTRINRKALTPRILRDAPAAFIAYDLLEADGEDMRQLPQDARRTMLESILPEGDPQLRISDIIETESWEALANLRRTSRERRVEGVMLKRRTARYLTGRVKGDWWKWKIEPLTIDAVLTFAQPGRGRRAGLLTDYTFGVWQGESEDRELVTIAKAYSGLDQEEIATLDKWLRANTTGRFGPVRQVTPHHVFELAFEGINQSDRHRGGIALRFPRISRWRTDKALEDADSMATLRELLDRYGTTSRASAESQPGLFDEQ